MKCSAAHIAALLGIVTLPIVLTPFLSPRSPHALLCPFHLHPPRPCGKILAEKGVCNMEIAEFDMRILKTVAKIKSGKSKNELVDLFGSEALTAINALLGDQLVQIHERSIKPFMRDTTNYVDPPVGNVLATDLGKLEVKRWKTKRMLTSRERWIERALGFFSGVAVTVLGGLILKWLAG